MEVKRDDKHDIIVSADGLTHTLKIKDVRPCDVGEYSFTAGDQISTSELQIDRKSYSLVIKEKRWRTCERKYLL